MADFRFVAWPTEFRRITQYFGANPHNYAQFGLPGHEGIDIRAPTGSRVFAVAAGKVIRIHPSSQGHNYGIHVRIEHQDDFKTIYAHLESINVREGQLVEAGEMIGIADNTGNSFGSHLHLTLKRKGVHNRPWPREIIDPLPYLLPLMGWEEPDGPYIEGWILTDTLTRNGELAQINAGGATLRVNPDYDVVVPAGTILIITGQHPTYTKVQASRAAVGIDETPPPTTSEPPVTAAMIRGWAWESYVTIVGELGVVGPHGINLRHRPIRDAHNIGLVKAGSTVILDGPRSGSYIPVKARRIDFIEPVALSEPPPEPGAAPGIGLQGWVLHRYLEVRDRLAIVSRFGVNLRSEPSTNGVNIALVKSEATVRIIGKTTGDYLPIMVSREDVLNLIDPLPAVQEPESLPASGGPILPAPAPLHDTTPGWIHKANLHAEGESGTVGDEGATLRNAPRRNADEIGFVPAGSLVIVAGVPVGEYQPVRVDDHLLRDPESSSTEPNPIGQAKIGLHASADPDIANAEFEEFRALRPGVIKVLSFHSPQDLSRLNAQHPDADWVLRAFLDFGGRDISPAQFFNDTISDMRRSLQILPRDRVVIELHNEPNIKPEGLFSSWQDGRSFSRWWLEVLERYRDALPGYRYLYPGLSPGTTVNNLKQDHIQFIEASRRAVEAADGLAIHTYWSHVYPMSRALEVVDDYISRFRSKSIWITEASNNKGHISNNERAQQYIRFWRELQDRPVVKGVTYFVASASNPDFHHEVWVGNGLGALIGRR